MYTFLAALDLVSAEERVKTLSLFSFCEGASLLDDALKYHTYEVIHQSGALLNSLLPIAPIMRSLLRSLTTLSHTFASRWYLSLSPPLPSSLSQRSFSPTLEAVRELVVFSLALLP